MRRQRDWQKTDPHLRRHPAFLRFCSDLGVTDNEAHGILAGLWAFAFDFAQDGDLARFSQEDVALAIGYHDDAEQLFMSLRQYFLDGDRIRSWEEWGGALFSERTFNAQRRWDQRHARKADEQEEVSRDNMRQSATVAPEKKREEKRREKDLKPLAPAAKTRAAVTRHRQDPLEGFAEFWRMYPKKERRGDAEKDWRKLSTTEREQATTAAAAVAYAVANGYREMEFVPQGATWVHQQRWRDWYDDDGQMIVPASYADQGNGKLQGEVSRLARVADEIDWGDE
jgi:hypothetical protein